VGPGARSRGCRAGCGHELTRVRYIVFYVEDVPAALEFYERAFGFERLHLDTEENGAYGELATGETTLAFASHELVAQHLPVPFRAHAPGEDPAGVELTLELEDLDAGLASALEHGATLVASPELKAWGQRVAFIRDPDGLLVSLTDPPPT
jgi:lactoylglutathione lyase